MPSAGVLGDISRAFATGELADYGDAGAVGSDAEFKQRHVCVSKSQERGAARSCSIHANIVKSLSDAGRNLPAAQRIVGARSSWQSSLSQPQTIWTAFDVRYLRKTRS